MSRWEIVRALPDHIPAIAADMRVADMREVWASHRHSPGQALEYSLERSDLAWTCLVDARPAFMWGVARQGSLISWLGAPWLLGTEALYAVQREFLKQSRFYVGLMQARFPRLENYVHAENLVSVRWLKWCGFTLESGPTQINGEPFYQFWRESHV